MKSFIVKEGIVWLSLVALTLVGFYNSGAQSRGVAFIVLAVGLAKFFLIFFEFMEMKHAHRVWQVSMGLFMLMLIVTISLSL
jgi:heme/copper-type cytochrome/quinol oxidase subunit 4